MPDNNHHSRDHGDSEDSWRDPTLSLNQGRSTPQQPYLVDTYQANQPDVQETNSPTRIPEGSWVIPVSCSVTDILGPQRSRIDEIQKSTGSYISYNKEKTQIDIWGDPDSVNRTKDYLELILSNLTSKYEIRRTTKKWDKPERELTERERRQAEKKYAKKAESRRYIDGPKGIHPYTSIFPLPDEELHIARYLGENQTHFNQMRVDCKAFIWYEPELSIVRIEAETLDNLRKASIRVRNWYLHCSRKIKGGTARILLEPTQNWHLQLVPLPPNFVPFKLLAPDKEAYALKHNRMIETVNSGVAPSIKDLISFDDDGHKKTSEHPPAIQEANKKEIHELLESGLESLRLTDYNIRMKIRFGQICLINYPKSDKYCSIEDVDSIFHKSKFLSVLAPCISKTHSGLEPLFEYLSENAVEIEAPCTTFTIDAAQHPSASPVVSPGQRPLPRGDMWITSMNISFNSEGQRRFWTTLTDPRDIVDISCTDIESHYSWDLRLQCARAMSSDGDTPHKKFADNLRISPSNRLIMIASKDYIPNRVTQKTLYKYAWNKDYIIEICHDEIWDIESMNREDEYLPVDLSITQPNRSIYKVSLYKEAWLDRFSQNLNLETGEAPQWKLRDFLSSPNENVDTLLRDTKALCGILDAVVPLYWNSSEASLV
ncbi:hypothetical protein BDB01DRAFT_773393 [Pilobolus umbonatus]|nr:hypothetical protein BDB01DRAFT_773393 [Pilobolus umbonatus]